MPSAYTNIAKPTDATYTRVNSSGRQIYDDPLIAYDDSSTFYDSVDINAYTNLAKPTGTPYTNLNKPTT